MSERGRSWIVLIAVFRIVKAVILVVLSTGALALVSGDPRATAGRFVEWLALDRDRAILQDLLDKVPLVTPGALVASGAGGLTLAALYSVEAYGLLRRRPWAEWLTIVATSVFIPFEIYELAQKVTPLRVGALVVNVLIVIYLVARRVLEHGRKKERPAPRAVAAR